MVENAAKESDLPLTTNEDDLDIYNPVLMLASSIIGTSIIYGGIKSLRSGECCICYIQHKHNNSCEDKSCEYSYQDVVISHAVKEEVHFYTQSKAGSN